MKYSEYLTNLIYASQWDAYKGNPIYLCNQIRLNSQVPIHPIYTPKIRLFIIRQLNRQEKELGIHTATLSPSAHKHFGIDYSSENLTQDQQNQYRIHILQKYLKQVIHLENIANKRKQKAN